MQSNEQRLCELVGTLLASEDRAYLRRMIDAIDRFRDATGARLQELTYRKRNLRIKAELQQDIMLEHLQIASDEFTDLEGWR